MTKLERAVEAAAKAHYARQGHRVSWEKAPEELRREIRALVRPAAEAAFAVATEKGSRDAAANLRDAGYLVIKPIWDQDCLSTGADALKAATDYLDPRYGACWVFAMMARYLAGVARQELGGIEDDRLTDHGLIFAGFPEQASFSLKPGSPGYRRVDLKL
ncbi:hypothetical protein CHELA1G11_70014 [Hyphomicrobiales bacterium]|nr:hypothetical protein CHELA1G11_70014 [Hyphomicrobiales bacterium]